MGESAELVVARLGAQGDGVADTPAGPIYVPYTLPGERVCAEIDGDRGRLVEVLQPSPLRVPPLCRHFGVCGGCALQHLEAQAYRDWKREQVVTAFASRGIDAPVAPVLTVPPGSRRRVVLSARRTAGGVVLGFHAARSHDIVDIMECPVAAPEIVRALPPLKALIAPLLRQRDEARITVLAAANGLDVTVEDAGGGLSAQARADLARRALAAGVLRLTVAGDMVVMAADPILKLGAADVSPPPGTFVQASAEAEARMPELVVAAAGKAKHVADLFSGLGTFTFPLAARARVLAIDTDRPAIEALQRAARSASGVKPIETRVRDLLNEPLSPRELDGFDAVVFDPPRAGAHLQAQRLARSGVPVAIAVSCNMATLARDARALIDGGYRLEAVTPIDQFLFSAHVEAVAVFRRQPPSRRST